MTDDFIPISAPVLNGNEKRYVIECLESNWISAYGRFVDGLESSFASYCGTRHAIVCCNGTAAVHLALMAAGVGPGDEVIVPTLTFVATANAVKYCGAVPVFVDSEEQSWNIDTSQLERALTPRTKAVMPVHLYGHVADMDAVRSFAGSHDLIVIEDAAEALGATLHGQMAGDLSDVAAFSLFGNKVITSGEGGVVVTNDDSLAERVRLFRGQGMDPDKRYWFVEVGHNYRMTNVAAALGLGQLEQISWHLAVREQLYAEYLLRLGDDPRLTVQVPADDSVIAPWLFSIRATGEGLATRDEIMERMAAAGIETRPVFYPMHTLPPYREGSADLRVSEAIAKDGLTLPLWAGMDERDVHRVCDTLLSSLDD